MFVGVQKIHRHVTFSEKVPPYTVVSTERTASRTTLETYKKRSNSCRERPHKGEKGLVNATLCEGNEIGDNDGRQAHDAPRANPLNS